MLHDGLQKARAAEERLGEIIEERKKASQEMEATANATYGNLRVVMFSVAAMARLPPSRWPCSSALRSAAP